MAISNEAQKYADELMRELYQYLEEGREYICKIARGKDYAYSGFLKFYYLKDGETCEEGLEEFNKQINEYNSSLNKLAIKLSLSLHELRIYTFIASKGEAIKIAEATPADIIETIAENVKRDIAQNGIERIESYVDLSNPHFGVNDFHTKDGVTEKEIFSNNRTEYEYLKAYIGEELDELYIDGSAEEVKVYANKAFNEWGIPQITDYADLKKSIFEYMNPHLEEGVQYVFSTHKNEAGGYNTPLFYPIKDGVKSSEVVDGIYLFSDANVKLLNCVNRLCKTFTNSRKTRVVAEKDKPLRVEECDLQMLKEDIKQYFQKQFVEQQADKIINNIEFSPPECDWEIVETEWEGTLIKGGVVEEVKYVPVDDYEMIYLLLDKKLDELRVEITADEAVLYADEGYPEFGIPALPEEDLAIESDDLETICRFLESGKADKITAAIEAVAKNKKTRKRIEKRYLNFIRVRLNNPEAQLEDLTTDLLTKKISNTIISREITSDSIAMGMMGKDDTKLLIDFIGSIVKNCLDIDEFIAEYKKTAKESDEGEELAKLQKKYCGKVNRAIKTEMKLCSKGWFSKCYNHLADMKLQKVIIEKADFYPIENLLVMREFMFFLNAMSKLRLSISLYETHVPDFTEMFWMFKLMPRTIWWQTSPAVPQNPLPFKREAEMKIDDGEWEMI